MTSLRCRSPIKGAPLMDSGLDFTLDNKLKAHSAPSSLASSKGVLPSLLTLSISHQNFSSIRSAISSVFTIEDSYVL